MKSMTTNQLPINFQVLMAMNLAIVICLVGCNNRTSELVPASGTVTINGDPAEGIMLQFVPETVAVNSVAPTSQAVSDDSGNFDLFTMSNEPGAVTGRHQVTLIDMQEERPAQGQRAMRQPRLDSKYANNAITVEVVAGQPIEIRATGPK